MHSKEIQPSLQGSQGKTEGYQRKRRHMKPLPKRIRDDSIEPFVARLGDDPHNLGFIGCCEKRRCCPHRDPPDHESIAATPLAEHPNGLGEVSRFQGSKRNLGRSALPMAPLVVDQARVTSLEEEASLIEVRALVVGVPVKNHHRWFAKLGPDQPSHQPQTIMRSEGNPLERQPRIGRREIGRLISRRVNEKLGEEEGKPQQQCQDDSRDEQECHDKWGYRANCYKRG